MKNIKLIKFKNIITTCISAILFSACFFIPLSAGASQAPESMKGVLDLRGWDFENDGVVKLNGEWEFYHMQFLDPGIFEGKNFLSPGGVYVRVPSYWKQYSINGRPISNHGYATYRLKILLPEYKRTLALKFLTAGSALTVYINGMLTARAGIPGISKEAESARYYPQVVDFMPDSPDLNIVIHLSNHAQNYAGLWLPLNLGNSQGVQEIYNWNIITQFFLVGIFIIMGLYHLALFFLRPGEKLPVYFALYLMGTALFITVKMEVILAHIFPSLPLEIILKIEYLSLISAIISGFLFLWKSFPKENHPLFWKFVLGLFGVYGTLVLITTANIYSLLGPMLQLLLVTGFLYSGVALARAVIHRREGSVIMAVGFVTVIITGVTDIMTSLLITILPHIAPAGLLVLVFSQSLMLARRFTRAFSSVEELSADLEAANIKLKDMNLNLEKIVLSRTEELVSAMSELEAINEEVIRARDSLWGEMELAKKIQTILLPKKPAIPGYDISVYMAPASEVGGDYYDVIDAAGQTWLAIGDVSGHGVPAGLIMMMVQTAIHVLLSKHPNASPSQLLTDINGTIYQNIQYLADDKYMTITVFSIDDKGIFNFSGLHQDVMVYRSDTGEVELIRTDGIWLGLMEDIGENLDDKSLILAPGDVMLLYTDGITEARDREHPLNRETNSIIMFGSNKLAELLSMHGTLQPDEIRTKILSELQDYNVNDDVTLMILKRE